MRAVLNFQDPYIIIFNFYISIRQEKAGRKWYQGVIHNCDGCNFDEILSEIKYLFSLYLQQLYF